jgi:hypothetical protein
MAQRLYRTVWGIETGDIIRTSYNTGPYLLMGITPPTCISRFPGSIVIHDPTISLLLKSPGKTEPSGINYVHPIDGRFFGSNGDEIFIEKPVKRRDFQVDMFESYLPDATPYSFRDGVDYALDQSKQRGIWKCKKHGDYNALPGSQYGPAFCPHGCCSVEQVIMHVWAGPNPVLLGIDQGRWPDWWLDHAVRENREIHERR